MFWIVSPRGGILGQCSPFLFTVYPDLGLAGAGGGGGGGGYFKLTYSGVLIFLISYLLSPHLCFGVLVHKDRKRVQVFQQIEKFH